MADEQTPAPVTTGPTKEEIEAKAARAEFMAPLLAVVQSDEFEKVRADLAAINTQYVGEVGYHHLFAVMSIMPNLKVWAESQ